MADVAVISSDFILDIQVFFTDTGRSDNYRGGAESLIKSCICFVRSDDIGVFGQHFVKTDNFTSLSPVLFCLSSLRNKISSKTLCPKIFTFFSVKMPGFVGSKVP